MGTHDGAVAIVTGASRGIGLGIAEKLVAEGAKVVLTARRQEALGAAVAHLGGEGIALGVAGNAADEDHQDEAVRAALDTFGRLDLLVNNTGINPAYGPMLDTELDVARKIMEVNVLSAFSWTRKAVAAGLGRSPSAQTPSAQPPSAQPPSAQPPSAGAVVNVASIAGLGATGSIGWYAVSKAALIHLTVELAYQLAPQVRVNAVAPAIVKTQFAQALYEGREAQVAAAYPMKRLGAPQDVAGAVSYLLSRDAAWVTGQTLVVDGGVTLGGGL